MSRRHKLQYILESILRSNNVYFQPPKSVQLKYPCIVYERANEFARNANDTVYLLRKSYTITLIDKNPDSEFEDEIRKLQYCSFNQSFASEGLNHFVFTIYF